MLSLQLPNSRDLIVIFVPHPSNVRTLHTTFFDPNPPQHITNRNLSNHAVRQSRDDQFSTYLQLWGPHCRPVSKQDGSRMASSAPAF